jgi:hypothetical protein
MNWFMIDQAKTSARHLVRAIYFATEGKSIWWSPPSDSNEVTRLALVYAVERGWMLREDNRLCLTDAGRSLIRQADER